MKTNSFQAWVLAARPKTLTGAVIPVMVGTSLALADDTFRAVPALCCFLFACGMQIVANFINDLYDFLKGTDREDRLGPERACAQGWITPKAMRRGILVAIACSCLAGLGLLLQAADLPWRGVELLLLGALCVLFAFLYTTKLSYLGWGDVLVLCFFGLVPVGGTYYVQAHQLTADALVAGVVCGLLIDTLLVVNNYRDREQDALSGKRTIVVRWGTTFGQRFYQALGIGVYAGSLWLLRGSDFFIQHMAFLYLFFHLRTWHKMVTIGSGKKLNSILGETSRNMLLMGLLLSAMILLAAEQTA